MNKKFRDSTIDIVRSTAIVLMVAANMAIIGTGTPPWIFRFISSLAAPIFLSLAMMMVALHYSRENYLQSSIYRCIFLIIVASLFDMSNSLLPLANIDILYLIGILSVIITLFCRLSILTLIVINIIILAVTPFLQGYLGYHQEMHFELSSSLFTNISTIWHELPHRYFIDGWFPIIPWVTIGIFGAILGKYRYNKNNSSNFKTFILTSLIAIAIGLIFIGSVLYYYFPENHDIRYDYIELFYPPAPSFMILAMGVILGLIIFIDFIGDVGIWAVIHPLGEAPLFMYLFHISVIDHILLPLGKIRFGLTYFIYYLILITIMILLGLLLRKIRTFPWYRKLPHFIRWIFG